MSQIILTAEQGEALWHDCKPSLIDGRRTAIIRQPVEPQPERAKIPIRVQQIIGIIPEDDLIEDTDWNGKTYITRSDLHAAILAHNWQEVNGNDGEPVVGERVELKVNRLVSTGHEYERATPTIAVATFATFAALPVVETEWQTVSNEIEVEPDGLTRYTEKQLQVVSVQWQLQEPPPMKQWYICDKHGWPVERIHGRYIQNFLRLLIHGRSIRRLDLTPKPDPSVGTQEPSP